MEEVTNKKIISSISWSMAEKILTDIVSMLVTLILSRLLLPSDYGLVALVQIFINISLIFVNTGLGAAIIQKKDASEEEVSTIFYINILLGIVIYAILYALAPLIAKYKKNELLCSLLRVLAIRIPISSFYSMQHAFIKKRLEFKTYFYSSLAGTIVAGFVGVYLAIKGYGVWALVFSTLTDQIMDSMILLLTTRWIPKFKISFSKSKGTISYGFKLLIKEFISRAYNQSRSLLIGLKYTSSDLAFSNKGQKIPEIVAELTESTMVRVMFPVFSSVQDDKNRFSKMISNTIKLSTFFVTPLMMGLFIIADKLIPLVFTDKWVYCIPYLRVCCFSMMIFPILNADLRAIEAMGKDNDIIKIQTINTTVGIITILISLFVFDNPLYIMIGKLIETIISTIVTISYTKKYFGYGYKEHIRDIKLSFLVSLIMSFIVLLVGKINIGTLGILILQILVGIFTYATLSIILKNDSAKFIINFLKDARNKV